MGYAVLAHRNFNLHARVIDLTQDLFDTPHRLAKQGRRFGQLDHHHLARLAGANADFGDQDILPIAFVFRRNDPDTTLVQQAANDRVRRALDNFHHTAFWAAFAVLPNDAHLDAILVQYSAHFVGWQVNITQTIVT